MNRTGPDEREQWSTACRIVRRHPKVIYQYDAEKRRVFHWFTTKYQLERGEALTILGRAHRKVYDVIPHRFAAEVHQVDMGGMTFIQAHVYLALVKRSMTDGHKVIAPSEEIAQEAMLIDSWGWQRPERIHAKNVLDTYDTLLSWGLLDEVTVGRKRTKGKRSLATIVVLTSHPFSPTASFTQRRGRGKPPEPEWGFTLGPGWDRDAKPLQKRWEPLEANPDGKWVWDGVKEPKGTELYKERLAYIQSKPGEEAGLARLRERLDAKGIPWDA